MNKIDQEVTNTTVNTEISENTSQDPKRPSVVILLTVYEPWIPYLNLQLQSIASQTFQDFKCIVAFDGPVDWAVVEECPILSTNKRFLVRGFKMRVGLYAHVERILKEFAFVAKYFAISDQDDIWLQNRLDSQVTALEKSGFDLVTDNALLVDCKSESLRVSLFRCLKISRRSMRYVLTTNFATGAGSLYRSEILELCLPFPDNFGLALHDHWLASVATNRSGSIVSDEQTWKYRQHDRNVVGAFRGRSRNQAIIALVQKLIEIVLGRDPNVDKQIAENVTLLYNRMGAIKHGIVDPMLNRNLAGRLKFLMPSELWDSRLDSLRIFRNSILKNA